MNVIFEERPAPHGIRIGIVTLDSEKTLNALTLPMVEAMLDHLKQWATDPAIVCVLLRGNGNRAFCAGADVRRLTQACREQPGEVPHLAARFFADEYRLDHLLHTFAKPVITWGHGLVLGGGLGLLQGASIRIVTPNSRLAMPEVSIGLYPDVGASWFLSRLPGKLGLFLGLTGTQINARDALDLDLADRCLNDDQQEELIEGLMQINWDHQATVQLHSLLHAMSQQARESLPEAQILPRRNRIDELLDMVEPNQAWHALNALIEDADPLFAQAARTMTEGCPLTVHLLWEQLLRARFMSLAQALRMEYAMTLNCCRYPEFSEGVRARLVDKDNRPHWHWPDIDTVPQTIIQAHFLPTWTGTHPLADLA